MGKSLFIAEKPSVAKEFANALKLNAASKDGYLEGNNTIITWCVGHLVTMSYPEVYDSALKKWSFQTLPFLPEKYLYEVIGSSKKQYTIVAGLLNRPDVDTIYVCTDSGREGEYIYRLVEQMAGVTGKTRKRVWIDSQTEEEIKRGIREAKDLSEYDNLSDAAYLRAKEDYLMGINFSRVLTLRYGNGVKEYLKRDRAVISVGRVMTCVLGIVVKREREIRSFVKTPFYRVIGTFGLQGKTISGEWRAVEGSRYYQHPFLYKENGFKERVYAEKLIEELQAEPVTEPVLESIEKKKEVKNAPLLYNLAELQNDCSKLFKISPDQTLSIIQELYEKKLVTYPRTDARVLSTAVAKEIHKNIAGLKGYASCAAFADEILQKKSYQGLEKTRYVNDKQITDHYAIIPTGQGLAQLRSLSPLNAKVYELIVRRFLSIFYPPAVYRKYALCIKVKEERFFANFKVLEEEGFLKVSGSKGKESRESKETNSPADDRKDSGTDSGRDENSEEETQVDADFITFLGTLKKGHRFDSSAYEIKEGETSPPKRYNSGSIILTIEDEELRAQIKGSGIGTSATRAEILKKLVTIEYLSLNKKTQVLTPTLMGEMVYDVVDHSIKSLLDPALTASWEKGLTMVANGEISSEEYMQKLTGFVTRRTDFVKKTNNQSQMTVLYDEAAGYYKK